MVAQLVPGAVRVDDDEVERRLDERRVVVAAVPEDHVGLGLRLREDRRVVDAGEDEVPLGEMRLVLLALLDRRVGGGEVVVVSEALHDLHAEVAVRHRVSEHGDALAVLAENLRDAAGRLALAGARAHGAHGDDGQVAVEVRLVRGEQAERRTGTQRARGQVHHVLVADVRVREHDLVDPPLGDQLLELVLGPDRDPVRIQAPCELGRVDASFDVRDLRGRERDHLAVVPLAIGHVEVVEIAAGRTCDQHSSAPHAMSIRTRGGRTRRRNVGLPLVGRVRAWA